MKKIFVVAMMTFVCIVANAQKWEMLHEKADELKGTPERTRYRLSDDEAGIFMFYDTGDFWKVGVNRNAFKIDPTHLNKNKNFIAYATIGLYDADGNLIEAWDNCELEIIDMYRVAQVVEKKQGKNKKGAYRVADYLRDTTGFVRILIPTQLGDGFEMKVPCLNNKQ